MPSRAVGNSITIEKSSKIYKEYWIKITNFRNNNVLKIAIAKTIDFKSVTYFDGYTSWFESNIFVLIFKNCQICRKKNCPNIAKWIQDISIISSIKPKFDDGSLVVLRFLNMLQTWNCSSSSANNLPFVICTRNSNQ